MISGIVMNFIISLQYCVENRYPERSLFPNPVVVTVPAVKQFKLQACSQHNPNLVKCDLFYLLCFCEMLPLPIDYCLNRTVLYQVKF